MDWESIVSNLADTRPALAVDGAQRVQFLNAQMAALLGWSADELSARGWVSTCVPNADRPSVRRLLAEGTSGTASSGQLRLLTRCGRRVPVEVVLVREDDGRPRGLVLVAQDAVATAEPEQPMWDCSCQVSLVPSQMGLVRSVRFLDGARDSSAYVGRPLSALLGDIGLADAEECARTILDGCSAGGVHVRLPQIGARFCIVSGGAVDDHSSVHLAVRCVDSHILPELVEAKVAQVAESSGLSDRERQVLQLLLRGRGVEDIATMLEIAPRTVKFHQANVLQKLGADSRVDLLRVVL